MKIVPANISLIGGGGVGGGNEHQGEGDLKKKKKKEAKLTLKNVKKLIFLHSVNKHEVFTLLVVHTLLLGPTCHD